MNNTRQSLAPEKILSYATKEIDSEIKITGLVAGDQMRGSAVQKYLSHSDPFERRNESLISQGKVCQWPLFRSKAPN